MTIVGLEKMKKIPKLFDALFSIVNLTSSYKSNEFNVNVMSLTPIIRHVEIGNARRHLISSY